MEQPIEDEIQNKGLTAPRVTPADIEGVIATEYYFTGGDGFAGALSVSDKFSKLADAERIIAAPAPLELLTFCVIVLRNGFTVTGESACVSPENFDAEIGRKVARANAVNKIWPLLGYQLKSELAYDEQTSLVSTHGGFGAPEGGYD